MAGPAVSSRTLATREKAPTNMNPTHPASAASASASRRSFLGTLALGTALFETRGLFAEELFRTPRQTEGPFYPNKLPLDTDNDLLIINDATTPAVGEVTYLTGRILDARGNPLQATPWSRSGRSTTTASTSTAEDRNHDQHDNNFQGYRPVPHRVERRVLLPHHQAGPLSRPDPPHPLQGQAGRAGAVDDAVLRQGRAAQREATESTASLTRPQGPRVGDDRFRAAGRLEDR